MKRIFVFLALMLILPAMAFAQFSIGPAMFLKSPVLLGQSVNIEEVNVNQFSFGGDMRYRIGWFQVEGLMLFSAGEVNSLDAFLDAGVALDISILSLSIGAGPNFTYNFSESQAIQAGLNTTIGADLRLGKLTIGTSYIMALDITDNNISVEKSSGLLGVHVLFQL